MRRLEKEQRNRWNGRIGTTTPEHVPFVRLRKLNFCRFYIVAPQYNEKSVLDYDKKVLQSGLLGLWRWFFSRFSPSQRAGERCRREQVVKSEVFAIRFLMEIQTGVYYLLMKIILTLPLLQKST